LYLLSKEVECNLVPLYTSNASKPPTTTTSVDENTVVSGWKCRMVKRVTNSS